MGMLGEVAAETEPGAYPLGWTVCFVALATLIYLLIDVYLTTKSFKSIFTTGAFHLLWLVYTVLALIAYGLVHVATEGRLLAFVGRPELAELVQVILAVGGALTVFQSFTVRISDFKVVDFGQFVDEYRTVVYTAISEDVMRVKQRKSQALAERVAARYSGPGDRLRNELNALLQLAGMEGQEIAAQLRGIEDHARETRTCVFRGYAIALVRIDQQRAADLLK